MNKKQFDNLRNNIFDDCVKLTETKGDDYTKGNEDVLINFKEGAFLGLTSYQILGVYMKKHIDSIFNYIKNDGQTESEPIEYRIQDAINYLVFLQALIKEKS